MDLDPATLTERLWPWVVANWEWVLAAIAVLVVAIAIRRGLSRFRKRSARTAMLAPERPSTQALDVATAAAAEISADIESYARALFTEDMAAQAQRAAANAPAPIRFTTIAEAPFIYDGVIMRDAALLPTALIAPVSNHFRQAQHILDALRRQGQLTAADATSEERVAALRAVAQALAHGIDKAVVAGEKLDQWLARNGGAFEPPRGLADLPTPALKGVALDRVGQRSKAFRTLREQAQAKLNDIDALIDALMRGRAPTPAGRAAPATPPPPPPSPRQAGPELTVVTKPDEKRAAE